VGKGAERDVPTSLSAMISHSDSVIDSQLEFYFSLNDELVKLVNLFLRTNGSSNALDAIDAGLEWIE
jgi:hypothetical protein